MLTEPLRAIQELLATNTELIHTQSEALEALRKRILELEKENQKLYHLLQTRGKAKQAPVCRAQPGLWMVGKRKKPGRKPSSIDRDMAEQLNRALEEIKAKNGCANMKQAAEIYLRAASIDKGYPPRIVDSRQGKDHLKQEAKRLVNRLRNRNSLK